VPAKPPSSASRCDTAAPPPSGFSADGLTAGLAHPDAASPWRARLATIGPWRVGTDTVLGPDPQLAAPTGDLSVLATEGDWIDVATIDDEVRTVVGVRRVDLALVVTQRTVLSPGPGGSARAADDGAPRVELGAGATVRIREIRGDEARIAWTDTGSGAAVASGWAPLRALDVAWHGCDYPSLASDLRTNGTIDVRAAPDGAALATLAGGTPLLAVGGPDPQGWRRVVVARPSAWIDGWVRDTDVAATPRVEPWTRILGGTGQPVEPGAQTVRLPAGTTLTSAAKGATTPFAVLDRDLSLPVLLLEKERVVVRIYTAWGPVPAAAACASVRAGQAGAAVECVAK
jgi:hypothetical protein